MTEEHDVRMFEVNPSDFNRSSDQTTVELEAERICLQERSIARRGETQIAQYEGDAKQVVIETLGVDDDAEIARNTCASPFEDACADEGQMNCADDRQRERGNRRSDD
jgi:hypothetical protein